MDAEIANSLYKINATLSLILLIISLALFFLGSEKVIFLSVDDFIKFAHDNKKQVFIGDRKWLLGSYRISVIHEGRLIATSVYSKKKLMGLKSLIYTE